MKPRRLFALSAAALLLAGGAILSAQTFSYGPEDDRRRAVGDWLIEDVGITYDGRTVRMSRVGDDFELDYHVTLYPGRPEADSVGFFATRGNCGHADDFSVEGGRPDAAQVRTRLADYLARCGGSRAEAAAALAGFDRAFAIAAGWTVERLAELSPMEPTPIDANMYMDADMTDLGNDVMIDANATVDDPYAGDTNMSDEGEPQ